MCFDRGLDVVLEIPVFRVGDVADAEHLLDFLPALVGDGYGFVLLIYREVAGVLLGLAGRNVNLLALLKLGNDSIDLVILVGRFFAGSGNDKRGAGFVNEDGINFVDDGEVVATLHAVLDVEFHVVAQVVEAELVVGAVGNVGSVSFAALVVIELVDNYANGQAQKTVELAHPFGVALGQIVIDGNHVHATAAEGVQVDRQGGDQRFSFAGLHFGDSAFVQNHASDELHVKVPHVQNATAGFADHGKGFYQDFVEDFFEGCQALGFELL